MEISPFGGPVVVAGVVVMIVAAAQTEAEEANGASPRDMNHLLGK